MRGIRPSRSRSISTEDHWPSLTRSPLVGMLSLPLCLPLEPEDLRFKHELCPPTENSVAIGVRSEPEAAYSPFFMEMLLQAL